MREESLSPRERRFVNEFFDDMDADKAAKRAGYGLTGIRGNDLVAVPKIAAAIEQEFLRRQKTAGMAIDEIIERYVAIIRANHIDYTRLNEFGEAYTDLSDLSVEQWYAISEISVDEYTEGRGDDARDVKRIKIKLHDKIKAMEALAKLLGLEKAKKIAATVVTVPAAGPKEAADVYAQLLNATD